MDYNFIGLDQLGLSAAALHTTARELTQIIYSLAAQPGYTSILRQEIFDVLAHSADNLTLESINMLWKMDSFMKETIRMQGPVRKSSDLVRHFAVGESLMEMNSGIP